MVNLVKHYAKLTAEERFVAAIEALARKDYVEARRLGETCPKFTYEPMRDVRFTIKYERLNIVVGTYMAMHYKLLSKLYCLAVIEEKGVDELTQFLMHLLELKAMELAFEQFAQQLGLTVEAIFISTGHTLDDMGLPAMDLSSFHDRVKECAVSYKDNFMGIWGC